MPFTLPATYASKADTGYGAVFAIDFGSGFVDLLEVKNIKNNGYTVPEVATTHLLSPNSTEEFSPGLIKPGTIDVGGNFIGSQDQTDIDTLLAQKRKIFPFRITSSLEQGAATYTATGTGYVQKRDVGPFENNKAIEFMVAIQTTGPITESIT